MVDHSSIERSSGRQIDWALVPDRYRTGAVVATVGAAGAAIGATSVPVAALTGAIPSGTTLDFGGAKFARLTAAAASGATTLTVAALPTALVSGDTATYAPPGSKKTMLAGTAVGTLLGAGKMVPRVVTTNPAVGFTETNATEDDPQDALSGYGMIVGGVVYENLLPDATGGPPATLPSAIKTELTNAGCTFKFEPYGDSRA